LRPNKKTEFKAKASDSYKTPKEVIKKIASIVGVTSEDFYDVCEFDPDWSF